MGQAPYAQRWYLCANASKKYILMTGQIQVIQVVGKFSKLPKSSLYVPVTKNSGFRKKFLYANINSCT